MTNPPCNSLDIIGNNDVVAKRRFLPLKQSPKGQFCPFNGRLLRTLAQPARAGQTTARKDMAGAITNNVYYTAVGNVIFPTLVGCNLAQNLYTIFLPLNFPYT
jgi:hypothetical protein